MSIFNAGTEQLELQKLGIEHKIEEKKWDNIYFWIGIILLLLTLSIEFDLI